MQDQSKNGTSAFNRAARVLGDWLFQQRNGDHDMRKADMLARVATFPGGPELLQQAADRGVNILVGAKKEIGASGYYNSASEPPVIGIANTGNSANMAIALWHELRHMRQHAANPGGLAIAGQLKDPRTAHIMSMMMEADAFTAETLLALQQNKAGNPEYHRAMFDNPPHGVRRHIRDFLRQSPYENFGDDAAFARALFTNLMTEGLLSYRADYFSRLGYQFATLDSLEKFQKSLGNSAKGGTETSTELASLYGPGFMSVSPKALLAAFYAAQPADEKQVLKMARAAVNRAPRLTEEEFQKTRLDILMRAQELYMKDPDEYFYPGAFSAKVGEALKRGAEKNSFTGRPRRGRSP